MDESFSYSDCELRHIDEGYDLSRAVELCAAESRRSGEEAGKSRRDEGWDEFRGDD